MKEDRMTPAKDILSGLLVYTLKQSPYSSHSRLLDLLPTEGGGSRVLDVGCGDGYIGRLLTARGYRVTGVERPGGYTAAFPRDVELVEADLDAGLPRIDGRYMYIVCADILEHLKDPARLLRQLVPLLEPEGVLVASLPNSGNLYFRLNILFGRFPEHDKGLFDRTHLHFFMLDGWRNLLAAAGYHMVRLEPTGIPVGLAVPSWQGSPLIAAAEWISFQLARMWKRLFAYQFVVTAYPERVL
ncbi:MAG: class I SAM-dependent methyltransferase [Bryobacterales bacterium]|nr:class I SAM-dependent methyltransferase [Bryobacterales bacterium]